MYMYYCFFFFKQKTAYEMRISDWSSDVCSSDLFTATGYKVTKITSSGCISPGSIVVVENAVMYWSRDGIYNLSTNQLGDIVAESVTKKSIQSLYNDIGQLETVSSEGVYDSYEQKVKWIYNNRLDGSGKDRKSVV